MAMIIHFVFAKGGKLFAIQTVRRFFLNRGYTAFIEFKHHFAINLRSQ